MQASTNFLKIFTFALFLSVSVNAKGETDLCSLVKSTEGSYIPSQLSTNHTKQVKEKTDFCHIAKLTGGHCLTSQDNKDKLPTIIKNLILESYF